MEKEAEKAEIKSSSLEQKVELTVRAACGLKARTFDCINDLEAVSEIRKDVDEAGGSGFIRADIMNAFYLSIHELIGQCEIYFAMHDKANTAELVCIPDEKDRFLSLLNNKKFDGICDGAEDVFRQKQYRQIKEAYFTDREAVVNNCYITYLEKKGKKKRRLWPFYLWGASLTALCLGIAVFQAASYFQMKKFEKKAESIESVFYESLKPENIIKSAEDYLTSKEGQEYLNSKYSQFRNWWQKENLAVDQLDKFWQEKVLPALADFSSEESDQRRAKYIVDALEKEYGLKTTVEEIARIFGKKKGD